ncbi:MAG: hypothetical protein RL215_1472 [Planctomycetota bacterium]
MEEFGKFSGGRGAGESDPVDGVIAESFEDVGWECLGVVVFVDDELFELDVGLLEERWEDIASAAGAGPEHGLLGSEANEFRGERFGVGLWRDEICGESELAEFLSGGESDAGEFEPVEGSGVVTGEIEVAEEFGNSVGAGPDEPFEALELREDMVDVVGI